MESVVTRRCPGKAASSFPRKKRSTPASRIVATSGSVELELGTVEADADNRRASRRARDVSPARRQTARSRSSFERGIELIRSGEFFAAHEELEDEWRAAEAGERDFFQGLVHVAVAWYQAGRGNRTGCTRQLEKAARRLAPYAPAHRGIDVASLLAQVERAERRVGAGSLELEPPDVAGP